MSTFFLKICRDFFQNFLSFLCSVLRISLSRRDRFVSVPAESAAETATVNHGGYSDSSKFDLSLKVWEEVRMTR